MSLINYYINGFNLKELDCYISQSSGLTDTPKFKETLSTNWQDEHGIVTDLKNRVYEVRNISLSCFFTFQDEQDFIQKTLQLNKLFNSNDLLNLYLKFNDSLFLSYMVYLSNEIKYEKTWRKKSATFSLEFTEPEPMKMVFKPLAEGEISIILNTVNEILINTYLVENNQIITKNDQVLKKGENTLIFNTSKNNPNNSIIISGNIGLKNECLTISDLENCVLVSQGL